MFLFSLYASLILLLRRFLFTALLKDFFGTEIIIREWGSPLSGRQQQRRTGVVMYLPEERSREMSFLPQIFSFFGKVYLCLSPETASGEGVAEKPSFMTVFSIFREK